MSSTCELFFTRKHLSAFYSNHFSEVTCKPTKAGNEIHIIARAGERREINEQRLEDQIVSTIQQWEDFSQKLVKVKQKFKNNLCSCWNLDPWAFMGAVIITQLSEVADLVAYFDGDENKVGKSWLSNHASDKLARFAFEQTCFEFDCCSRASYACNNKISSWHDRCSKFN